MQQKMRYRLGLDMGSTSIGWAMIRLDSSDRPCAVIRAGARIFSDGRNPKDGSSLAVTRRAARQMRRRRDRLLKRKQRMLEALIRWGFFPTDEAARKALAQLDPYALRAKGLSAPLTGPEFARALFHINQRRGFQSNRKTDRQDSESGALKKAISTLRTRLEEEKCQTLGQWLAKRHDQRLSVRARLRGKTQKDKAYDFYADRAMVAHEFDALWSAQTGFNPDLFTEAARNDLRDTLLFQRPLKPVKPGRCTLLPDEERAPLALPSTQRFRILQELNNLRVLSADLTELPPLSKAQRDALSARMERKERLTFAEMVKALKLPGTTKFNLQDAKRDALKGNSTSVQLSKKQHFGDRWHDFTLVQQDAIVLQLLNEPHEGKLIDWLKACTDIADDQAEAIAQAGLPEGYGRLSIAALTRILPPLARDVITYADATKLAGFDSHSELGHAQTTGELLDELPYYGKYLQRHVAFAKDNPRNDEERYGKIANPTVHIALNELRKVINALIKRYGKPAEVIVEVARELKLGQQRKLEIQREQKERQDLNDKLVTDACEILHLTPTHLDKAKRRELSQKMQLWRELNRDDVTDRRCPYKVRVIPGRMTALLRGKFGLNQLLSGDSSKNRNDHRHHALDATVIAITDQALLQCFAQASASARERQLDRLVEEMPLPWPSFREHVARAMAGITISHRPDHGYQGAMHEETAWGLRGNGEVARLVRDEGAPHRRTEHKKSNVISISSTVDPNRHGLHEDGTPIAYKGYVGGSNYCLEIWRDQAGKPDARVISTFEAYQVIRQHGAERGERMLRDTCRAINGLPLIARLMINDMVSLETDGQRKVMRVVKIYGTGQFFMCEHHEANVDARNSDKTDAFAYLSKMPGSFLKAKGRAVTISPIGDVRRQVIEN